MTYADHIEAVRLWVETDARPPIAEFRRGYVLAAQVAPIPDCADCAHLDSELTRALRWLKACNVANRQATTYGRIRAAHKMLQPAREDRDRCARNIAGHLALDHQLAEVAA